MLTLLIKFIQFSLLLFCGTGTRAGGGMGENMATPDLWISTPVGDNGDWIVDPLWVLRSGYDFFFFLIIIIIIMNILFGIIIDTFSDLRTQRDEKTTNKETTCFICGIGREQFDQEGTTDFKRHCAFEHNKWHYLFYLIHCQLLAEDQPDDINAYERFVHTLFLEGDISWMPLGKALTMGSGDVVEDEEDSLKETVNDMKNDLQLMQAQMNQMMLLFQQNMKK
jgi:hypothetical protein